MQVLWLSSLYVEVGSPLTVDVNDLVNIVANNVETDDGVNDGVNYQWQFSVDNNNWDDIIVGKDQILSAEVLLLL